MCQEERDVLRGHEEIDKCGMEKFGKLDSSEKTIAILGDRWWPQTAKQEGGKKIKKIICKIWKKCHARPNVELSISLSLIHI